MDQDKFNQQANDRPEPNSQPLEFTPEAQADQSAAQPVQPAPEMQPAPPAKPKKPKKSKKLLLITGLIVAIVLVVLGGGGALAYNLWYQNPDKVLADSMSKLVSSDSLVGDGKLVVSSPEMQATVDLSNKLLDGRASVVTNVSIDSQDMKFDIDGNVIYDKDGTVYVKVDNLAELFNTIISAQMAADQEMTASEQAMAMGMAQAIFQPMIDTIDGQWIKIVPEELADDTSSDDLKCVQTAYSSFADDQAVRDELMNAYDEHRFMVVDEELGSKDGNIGFSYKLDQQLAKDFGKAVEQTELGKKLADCEQNETDAIDDQEAEDIEDMADDATVKLEIWADRWTHQLADLKLTVEAKDDQKLNFDYTPDYSQDVKIEVPTDAMTTDELSQQVEGLFSL